MAASDCGVADRDHYALMREPKIDDVVMHINDVEQSECRRHAGDFTCTVTADSYMIPDGRIAEPANTIRINDNIATFFNHVIGVI
jgi:hypothetical protein